MAKISYEYSTWNEKVEESGEISILFSARGSVEGSGESIEIFSTHLKPHYLAVKGSGLRGVYYEGDGLSRFYVLAKDPLGARRIKIRVTCRGVYPLEAFDGSRYNVNLEWRGRHIHAILFPPRYRIVSVSPKGYKLKRDMDGVLVSWLWRRGFKGTIRIELSRSR